MADFLIWVSCNSISAMTFLLCWWNDSIKDSQDLPMIQTSFMFEIKKITQSIRHALTHTVCACVCECVCGSTYVCVWVYVCMILLMYVWVCVCLQIKCSIILKDQKSAANKYLFNCLLKDQTNLRIYSYIFFLAFRGRKETMNVN